MSGPRALPQDLPTLVHLLLVAQRLNDMQVYLSGENPLDVDAARVAAVVAQVEQVHTAYWTQRTSPLSPDVPLTTFVHVARLPDPGGNVIVDTLVTHEALDVVRGAETRAELTRMLRRVAEEGMRQAGKLVARATARQTTRDARHDFEAALQAMACWWGTPEGRTRLEQVLTTAWDLEHTYAAPV